jgi:hypothetical protein
MDFRDFLLSRAASPRTAGLLVPLVDAGVDTGKATYGDILGDAVTATFTDPGFDPAVQAVTAAQLVAGANVTITPGAGTLTIAASGGGGGGTALRPNPIPGSYYPVVRGTLQAAGGAALNTSTIRLYPIYADVTETIEELGARVVTLSAAGNFQILLYASDPTTGLATGLPLVYTPSTLSTGSANTFVSGVLNANFQKVAGTLYWIGIAADNATATFNVLVPGDMSYVYFAGATPANIANAAAAGVYHWFYGGIAYANVQTTNINPASIQFSANANRIAAVWEKVLSVP